MGKGAIEIYIDRENIKTKLQQKLETLLNDPEVEHHITQIVADNVKKYVPRKSGALANEGVTVGTNTITWDKPYAHYQYVGEVYGPNFQVIRNGELVWRSPKGKGSKHPTGWPLTYHTPGTSDHWIDAMWENDKRSVQLQITNYLKRAAKQRGLS